MEAFNAQKDDPVIRECWCRLASRGKTIKQSMTVCRRKLLVRTNAPMARGQLGDPARTL